MSTTAPAQTTTCDDVECRLQAAAKVFNANRWTRCDPKVAIVQKMECASLLRSLQWKGRIAELEHKNATNHGNVHVDGDDLEQVDKSVVVVGGFNEKTVEEAEALVQQMMVGIAGFKNVEMIDGESPLGLANFESPMQAMKFIRSQKKMARSTQTSCGHPKIVHGQNAFDARS